MTQLPRHAKVTRIARRPVLRAVSVVPAVLGLILATSVGMGAVASADHWLPTAMADERATATPSATATAEPRTAAGSPEDVSDDSAASSESTQATLPQGVPAQTGALEEAVTEADATTSAAPEESAPTATGTDDAVAAEPDGDAAGMRVQVQDADSVYVSSSSTDRPLLMFFGWEDETGRPLGSQGSVTTPVQIRLVSESGSSQSATIYPYFTNGRSNYGLPLWPFTQAMDPHVGRYNMQWRQPSAPEWQTVDTLTIDVRLPEATAGATLSYVDGALVGTGWAFDRSVNIAGTFKVALDVTDAAGNTSTVNVRARFLGDHFVVSAAALESVGVRLAVGYTVSARPTSVQGVPGGDVISVHIGESGEGSQTPQPTEQPTQPDDLDPTAEPTPGQSAEPSAQPHPTAAGEPSQSSAAPTSEATATTDTGHTAAPTGEATTAPSAPAAPAAQPTAVQTPSGSGTTGGGTGQVPSTGSSTAAARPTAAPTSFEVLNEGVEIDPLIVQETNTPSGTSPTTPAAHADQPAAEPASQPAEGADSDSGARPSMAPASPVQDANELGPDNAGSLSGTRQGVTITLIFPSAKVHEGDWVAVFVFPGATTAGWVQVGADNSVSVDISALDPGSYKIAVADRDSELLGWAQLEIAGTTDVQTDNGAGVTLITGEDLTDDGGLGPDGWKLVSAGLLLVLGATSFIMLAFPGLHGNGTRITRR
ncbi:hypothetical protein [Actinomyces procaprae]|uniref:hypothetical protein n=2 Tax=Actinomyces procaprae TaxID=2560010 RepID=UPI001FF70FF8|nr:hypothetical protein [Actinomyces procaprae]